MQYVGSCVILFIIALEVTVGCTEVAMFVVCCCNMSKVNLLLLYMYFLTDVCKTLGHIRDNC
jgi:hypothetical protein